MQPLNIIFYDNTAHCQSAVTVGSMEMLMCENIIRCFDEKLFNHPDLLESKNTLTFDEFSKNFESVL